jgi:hypothetical protein
MLSAAWRTFLRAFAYRDIAEKREVHTDAPLSPRRFSFGTETSASEIWGRSETVQAKLRRQFPVSWAANEKPREVLI